LTVSEVDRAPQPAEGPIASQTQEPENEKQQIATPAKAENPPA
jgi:hypothetical protein